MKLSIQSLSVVFSLGHRNYTKPLVLPKFLGVTTLS